MYGSFQKSGFFCFRTTKKSGRDEADSGSPDFVLDLDNLLERLAEDPGYIALLSGKELELLAEMDPDEIINGNVATSVLSKAFKLEVFLKNYYDKKKLQTFSHVY